MRPRGTSSSGDRDGNTYVTAEVLRKAVGRPQPYRRHSLHDWEAQMIQMKIRWGDLGAPTKPGAYPCGPHMVEITPGDTKLAEGNPDAVFIAIPHQSLVASALLPESCFSAAEDGGSEPPNQAIILVRIDHRCSL